ncbi:MAG TPA: cupin domain-containing protein [Trebonia sp.]|nr:cupin domain-containing protein [Trebonia sp.]
MTPSFPGATALTVLDVYDWVAPDGLRGGSAHVHLASAEGYLVMSGAGELQTLGARGYAATPLHPGDCVWFTPGTIHRLVNDGGLRLAIVMQNAGLPEHGDAVLTFPPAILADQEAYAEAATLTHEPARPATEAATTAAEAKRPAVQAVTPAAGTADADDDGLAGQARRRASLAVEGYLALRDAVAGSGPAALEDFFAAALRLKAGQAADWRDRWQAGALAVAAQTGADLDEIADRTVGHLTDGGLWRIASPEPEDGPATRSPDTRSYGMCGRLTTYPASSATRLL